jgi:hypothetical protein
MAKFSDAKGRPWLVEITVGAYRRLKRDTPLDLDQLAEDGTRLAEIIYGPPFALAAVAECLLGEQVKAAGLTVDEFADAFDPATVDRFGDALLEAIVDFFLRGRAGKVKEALGQKMKEAADGLLSPSNNSPASAPASSDSTPLPTPSANSRGCLPGGAM